MKPVFWLFATVAAVSIACGGGEPAGPTPTPASRYTAEQARAVIREYQYPSGDRIARATCDLLEIRYEKGIWICGRWSLDETTGTVFKTPD